MGERIDQERERASGFSALGRMRLNINPSLFKKKKKENRPFVRPALSFSLLCGSLPSACCGNLCERCRHPCACIIKAEKESGRSFVVVVGGASGGCRRGASPTQMTGSSPGRKGGWRAAAASYCRAWEFSSSSTQRGKRRFILGNCTVSTEYSRYYGHH